MHDVLVDGGQHGVGAIFHAKFAEIIFLMRFDGVFYFKNEGEP
jgi:hypothetical protein